MSTAIAYDRSWRFLSDDDLRRWLTFYRRRLALVAVECDDDTRAETRDYLAMLVADAEAEDAQRDRCVSLGIPRDRTRFAPEWLDELKRRIRLDALCEHEMGATLGKERRGKRQGPCPLCGHGENCFTVYIADDADQHYYCFRCGRRGDAIGAMMETYRESFVDAVARLARHGNIPLPPPPTAATGSRHDARLASLPGRLAD